MARTILTLTGLTELDGRKVAVAFDLLYNLVWSVEIVAAAQPTVLCAECGQAMLLIACHPPPPALVPLGQPP